MMLRFDGGGGWLFGWLFSTHGKDVDIVEECKLFQQYAVEDWGYAAEWDVAWFCQYRLSKVLAEAIQSIKLLLALA